MVWIAVWSAKQTRKDTHHISWTNCYLMRSNEKHPNWGKSANLFSQKKQQQKTAGLCGFRPGSLARGATEVDAMAQAAAQAVAKAWGWAGGGGNQRHQGNDLPISEWGLPNKGIRLHV